VTTSNGLQDWGASTGKQHRQDPGTKACGIYLQDYRGWMSCSSPIASSESPLKTMKHRYHREFPFNTTCFMVFHFGQPTLSLPPYDHVTERKSIRRLEFHVGAVQWALPAVHRQDPSSTSRRSQKRRRRDSKGSVEGLSTPLVTATDDREASAEASTSTRLDDVLTCRWKKCGEKGPANVLDEHVRQAHLASLPACGGAPRGDSFTCGWRGCSLKKTLSLQGLRKHIDVVHIDVELQGTAENKSSDTRQLTCRIDGCGTQVQRRNFPRHLKDVHLKIEGSVTWCTYCRKHLRTDMALGRDHTGHCLADYMNDSAFQEGDLEKLRKKAAAQDLQVMSGEGQRRRGRRQPVTTLEDDNPRPTKKSRRS